MLGQSSLFRKILLSHMLVILITITSAGLLLSHLVSEYLIDARKNQLLHDGEVAAQLMESRIDAADAAGELENISALTSVRMWIVTRQQQTIGSCPMPWSGHGRRRRGGHHTHSPPAPPAPERQLCMFEAVEDVTASGKAASWVRKSPRDNDPSIVVAVPLANKEAALFLYTPIFGITKTANAIQQLLLHSIAAAFFAAVLTAFFIARNLTKPIEEIARAAGAFAGGDYQSRAAVQGSDEIAKLGRDFNRMAQTLEQTEVNRREFFSNVTHELKTPIASIQLLAETLLDDMADSRDTHDRYLQTILDETHRLSRLVSDLLDLERLESGNFGFRFSEVDIKLFHEKLAQKFQPQFTKKSLQLTASYDGEPYLVHTDAFRLEQILTNLISNAARHSPPQSAIAVRYHFAERFVFTVTDHGEGISAEHLPHIWERFYRADKARSRAEGGTGLGLSITKKLCEELGGAITARSEPQKETTFTVTLPPKE